MRYTRGGNPDKTTKGEILSTVARVEGKGCPTGETPLDVPLGMARRDLPFRDARYEAMGRHSESDRVGGEMSDDGGTSSSSFNLMECVGVVVGTSA